MTKEVSLTFSNKSHETKIMADINDLKGVADKLNKESDALQEILKNLNEKLGALNIGLEVWLYKSTRHYVRWFNTMNADWSLGYTKTNEGWCVAVRLVKVEEVDEVMFVNSDPDYEPMPLLKASRSVRIEASKYFEWLIEEIQSKIEESLKTIDSAKRAVEKL